jgi:hypothetical protein
MMYLLSACIWLFAAAASAQVDRGLGVQTAATPTAVIDAHCYSYDGEQRCADKIVDSPRWNRIYQGPFAGGTPGTPTPAIPPTPTVGVGTPTPIPAAWCYCCARGPNPNAGRVLISVGPQPWGGPGIYLSDGDCVRYPAPATGSCSELYVTRQNVGDYVRCDMQ